MNNALFIIKGNGSPLVMTQVLLHPCKGTANYLDQYSKVKNMITP